MHIPHYDRLRPLHLHTPAARLDSRWQVSQTSTAALSLEAKRKDTLTCGVRHVVYYTYIPFLKLRFDT